MYCKNCGTMLNDNQEFCANCGVKAGGGGRFCQNCGGELMPGANVCEKCGAPVNNPETPPVTPPPANGQQNGAVSGEYLNGKDKTTMAIICFLLGGLGIHNFMMGENKKGIVKIVASLCFGIGYILAIIDFVKILTGSYVVDPDVLVVSVYGNIFPDRRQSKKQVARRLYARYCVRLFRNMGNKRYLPFAYIICLTIQVEIPVLRNGDFFFLFHNLKKLLLLLCSILLNIILR